MKKLKMVAKKDWRDLQIIIIIIIAFSSFFLGFAIFSNLHKFYN